MPQNEAIYRGEGDAIQFTPAVDVECAEVVVLGDIAGYTKVQVAANTLGTLHLKGRVEMRVDDASLGTDVFASDGRKAYWDSTARRVVATATGNQFIGHVVQRSATDNKVWIRWFHRST